MELFRLIAGLGFPPTEDRTAQARRNCATSQQSAGLLLPSVAGDPGCAEPRRKLRGVGAPTLVIHGDDDPLVPKAGGEQTAASVPGARLHIVPGMGHLLPEALVPLLVEDIARHCLEAGALAQDGAYSAAGGSP